MAVSVLSKLEWPTQNGRQLGLKQNTENHIIKLLRQQKTIQGSPVLHIICKTPNKRWDYRDSKIKYLHGITAV
jgi:hypothetical protein